MLATDTLLRYYTVSAMNAASFIAKFIHDLIYVLRIRVYTTCHPMLRRAQRVDHGSPTGTPSCGGRQTTCVAGARHIGSVPYQSMSHSVHKFPHISSSRRGISPSRSGTGSSPSQPGTCSRTSPPRAPAHNNSMMILTCPTARIRAESKQSATAARHV